MPGTFLSDGGGNVTGFEAPAAARSREMCLRPVGANDFHIICDCTVLLAWAYGSPPLAAGGEDSTINPFIRYWEPARFDRGQLELAHQHHEQHRRRRRSINYEHSSATYGAANVVRLNFRAHDREFRLVLREDPSSVFARNVQIESTDGPMDYDLSRIYTGIVEDQPTPTILQHPANDG
uniref:Uncharacterized protein n=1 Tax=Anopheles atroparvus TaxID=41427 RepID=A0A182J024_ANOAO